MAKITVVGSGVSGLTCAVRLQADGHEVTIITRALPAQTTSAAAGAVWYGHGEDKVRQWAQVSLKRFTQLLDNDESGILQVRLREVYPFHIETPWFADELPYCQRIPTADLPDGYVDGFIMDVPLVEPPRYLNYLQSQFEQNGGQIIERELQSLDEITGSCPIIVNCSGVGARELVNDAQVYPIRGQTILIDAPEIQQAFMDDNTFTYIFPRKDGVVLGGIAQPNNNSLTVDERVSTDILSRCIKIEPSIQHAHIKGYTVGLRPGRYAVRLEAQLFTDTCAVIHNYGHAGVGFTLSWGCAEEVLRLLAFCDC
jgi:D-amino-acid oxidase